MMRRVVLLVILLLPLVVGDAGAQGSKRRQRLGAPDNPPARQQLEMRLRQGLWRVAKNRIGFTDDQMARLTQTSQRFDGRRRELAREERQQRLTLRREILAGTSANQSSVGSALDRLLQLQRARVDLQIEEQGEFAAFMTPLQRAKYASLQEQLRRRVENLQRQRAESTASSGAGEIP
ncbi:MAG: hypothetical protein ABIP93_05605 [Gemmatimonadaceae bacterium]